VRKKRDASPERRVKSRERVDSPGSDEDDRDDTPQPARKTRRSPEPAQKVRSKREERSASPAREAEPSRRSPSPNPGPRREESSQSLDVSEKERTG
jgi:hypothetical protein